MTSPDEMVDKAKGEYSSQYITQTNSVNTPIIDLLDPEEQLHFVFFHTDKGFRITEPDGEERTPDHTSLSDASGKRFLLVTDKRILYLVGKPEEEEDEIQEFEYEEINSVEGYRSMGFPTIEFETDSGKKYKFVNHANESDTVQNVAEYIRNKISSPNQKHSNKDQTNDSVEIKYCSDCGAEVKENDTFCHDCGSDLEELEPASEDTRDNEAGEETTSGNIDNTSSGDSENIDSEETKWTLSFVIGLGMAVISGILALLYFMDGNVVSAIFFGIGFMFGSNYLNGQFNISKWLATAIFLLFWMLGSFFIGV
jgi:rRNA maturation endonuclease Nob1